MTLSPSNASLYNCARGRKTYFIMKLKVRAMKIFSIFTDRGFSTNNGSFGML